MENDNQRTPLHLAASEGDTKTIKALLEANADPNVKAIDGAG